MVVALGGKSSESFPGLTRILPLYEEANELEASFQTQTFNLFLPLNSLYLEFGAVGRFTKTP